MKRRAFCPDGLDGSRLESRALLSGMPRHAMVAIASTEIRGSSRGNYSTVLMSDGAPMVSFRGPAVPGRKLMAISGTLHGIAPFAEGSTTGTAVIGPKKSRINVSLASPVRSGTSIPSVASEYTLTVTGGTGKYANAMGTGEASVVFRQVGAVPGKGKFTLIFTINLN